MRLIDADQLRKDFKDYFHNGQLTIARRLIDCSLTVYPHKGSWMIKKKTGIEMLFIGSTIICSNCEQEPIYEDGFGYHFTSFCPHCGAIMQNPNEGE
jgi:hypothetical protein